MHNTFSSAGDTWRSPSRQRGPLPYVGAQPYQAYDHLIGQAFWWSAGVSAIIALVAMALLA